MKPVSVFALLAYLSLCVTSAAADQRAVFYGSWGTQNQCASGLIAPGGTVRAEPFEITEGWLRHGKHWCRLTWGPIEKRADGYFTAAHALCGEDTHRAYFLGMVLTDGELTLRWDFPWSNGPLARCPVS